MPISKKVYCPKCGRPMSNRGAKLCRMCNAESRRIPEEIKRKNRKKYKSEYFQKNKEKIYQKIKERESNYTEEERIERKRKKDNSIFKARYGISVEEIDAFYITQKGKCYLCNSSFYGEDGLKMTVDHNHCTGKFRSLLCHKCNSALGLFKENIETLKNAIKYLENEKACNN